MYYAFELEVHIFFPNLVDLRNSTDLGAGKTRNLLLLPVLAPQT